MCDIVLTDLSSDYVMATIYSPLLVMAAFFETKVAAEINANRQRGDEDDDTIEEWEQMNDQIDFEADGWNKTVDGAKSNLEQDPAVFEVQKLRDEVGHLKQMIEEMHKAVMEK